MLCTFYHNLKKYKALHFLKKFRWYLDECFVYYKHWNSNDQEFLHCKKKVVLVITGLREVELENIKFPSGKPAQLSKAASEIKFWPIFSIKDSLNVNLFLGWRTTNIYLNILTVCRNKKYITIYSVRLILLKRGAHLPCSHWNKKSCTFLLYKTSEEEPVRTRTQS